MKLSEEVDTTREKLAALMLVEAKKIDPSIAEWIDDSLRTQSAICTLEMLQAAVSEARRKRPAGRQAIDSAE